MTETPQQAPDASSDPATQIDHNIRIVYLTSGEHIIANFGQVREEDKFVAYQLLYPLTLSLTEGDGETLELITNGDNDQGPDDWYVPEFGTLLMPIASVLLIVGYNYRRKDTEA